MTLSSSRTWLSRSGPSASRSTTLRFVLRRPAIVEFVVVRVAPDCTRVGSIRVAGRAGVNRVRFRGRIRGKPLTPGTYLIRARTVGGQTLAKTRLVVFDRPPRPEDVRAARAANVCGGGAGGDSAVAYEGTARGLAGGTGAKPGDLDVPRVKDAAASSAGKLGKPPLSVGVLGERFTRVTDAVREIHPLIYILLGVAIALLALAAIPARFVPNDRVATLLAYRRDAVAFSGAAALVTVMLLYALV